MDDFYASLEWSAGGLIHAHIAFGIVGAPRIDKVVVPAESKAGVVEVDATAADAIVLPQEQAANVMASFWDRVISEFNVAKHTQAVAEVPGVDAAELQADIGTRTNLGKRKRKQSTES